MFWCVIIEYIQWPKKWGKVVVSGNGFRLYNPFFLCGECGCYLPHILRSLFAAMFQCGLLWCCVAWMLNVYNVKRSFLIVDTEGGNLDTPRGSDDGTCGFVLWVYLWNLVPLGLRLIYFASRPPTPSMPPDAFLGSQSSMISTYNPSPLTTYNFFMTL
jgi:hypothetical protein